MGGMGWGTGGGYLLFGERDANGEDMREHGTLVGTAREMALLGPMRNMIPTSLAVQKILRVKNQGSGGSGSRGVDTFVIFHRLPRH